MIVYGALIIVIIVTVIFYLRNPEEYKWWEFAIPLVFSLAITFGAKALVERSSVMFTEYWGETITSIYEEEPWNEWIVKTCTERYACGTDSDGNTQYCTRTYDCSYQDDHRPKWYAKTDIGNTFAISEHLYDSLFRVYGGDRKVVRTRRNHSATSRASGSRGTKFDGTRVGRESYVYQSSWQRTEDTRKGVYTRQRYENRIKASDLSLFNIDVVCQVGADTLGLFDYPESRDIFNFPTILGADVSPEIHNKFRRLNAKFGPSNQLRLWILVFEDKPSITGVYQENYWVNGNKNELVICIGKSGENIQWSYAFSWGLNGALTAEAASKVLTLYQHTVVSTTGQTLPVAAPLLDEIRDAIATSAGVESSAIPPALPIPIGAKEIEKIERSATPVLTDLTWREYYTYLDSELGRFERRSFKEFSYLKVEPSLWQIILIYFLTFAASFGLNWWVSTNEIHDKKPAYNTYNRFGKRRY